MPRSLALAFAALLAAVVVAPALAKELQSARVCAADECTTTTDRGQLAAIAQDRGPGAPPPASEQRRSYSVDLAVRADGPEVFHVHYRYYPDAKMTRYSDGAWVALPPQAIAALESLAAQVDDGGSGVSLPTGWGALLAASLAVSLLGATAAAVLVRRARRPQPSLSLRG